MIDWNNDGEIDGQDIFLTEMLLEEEGSGQNGEKPTGCCAPTAVMLLFLLVSPIVMIVNLVAYHINIVR